MCIRDRLVRGLTEGNKFRQADVVDARFHCVRYRTQYLPYTGATRSLPVMLCPLILNINLTANGGQVSEYFALPN